MSERSDEDDGPGLAARLLAALERRLRYRPPPRVRKALLGLAALVFLGGGLLSLRAVELDPSRLRWLPLAASAVLGVPLIALAGALEYALMARATGRPVGMRRALRVSVLASAANLLPVPGSVLVRIKALTGEGSSLVRSTTVTGVLGFTWIAVALAVAGGFLLADGRTGTGAAFLAGAVVPGSGLFLLRWVSGRERWKGQLLPLVAVEAFTVCVAALRFWLVLLGLGEAATWTAAFVFPVAGSLTAAVGVFPGGMGLREVLTAALAPLVGLPASLGFLVSAVNRVLAALGFAPLAGLLMVRADDSADDAQPPSTSARQPGSSP